MGQIVGAAVVSHQPGVMAPQEVRLAIGGGADTSLVDGFGVMKKAIEAAGADTFVIFDTHWFTTREHVIAGAKHYKGIYTSDELPALITDYRYDYAGAPELARAIAEVTRERNIRVQNCSNTNVAQHYPTLNLIHYLRRNQKVLSTGVCQSAQAHNFIDFGAAIGEAVKRTNDRVVLLASGGMSHGFWPYDTILQHSNYSPEHVVTKEARAMDEAIIELWHKGDHAAVVALYPEYRKHSPEGFFGHYLMMLGALGGDACRAKGTKMSNYENAVGTGQLHMWFDVAA
jgi:3,4-dihydroxyphenylacetate 2,3-dioxygenase